MVENRRVLGRVWSACHGAWRSLRAALAGAEVDESRAQRRADRAHQRSEIDAEAGRLKAQLRESGFGVPRQLVRQRAAARLCLVIDERGKDEVERVLMKVSR